MSDYGIDYGSGLTNIDKETGIHFGVIPENAVLQAWADSSEGDYGPATCPKCGNDAVDIDDESVPELPADGWEDDGRDYACLDCKYSFSSDDAYGDEPQAYVLDDGEYKATADEHGDIFITKSPCYTHAQYCSPCAPGACHLENPVDENGPKAYCFGQDWFDGPCPYPIYRVSDNECIYRPNEG